MGYSNEKLAGIAAKLKAMPVVEKKKREHNKQEAIQVLAKEIAAARKRGHSLEQIAKKLRDEGLDISTSSLKNYLRPKAEKNAGQKVLHHEAQKEAQQAQQNTVVPEHEKSTDTDKSEPSSKVPFTPKPDSDDI